MSENLRSFITGASILRSVANRVPDGSWDRESCCAGWNARQVAGHITHGLATVAALAAGDPPPAEQPEADLAGDDLAATVNEAVDRAIEALDHPDSLDRPTPMGPMNVDQFLAVMGVDTLTHAWDIADATGIDHGIDAASAERALTVLEPMADRLRGPGRFDDAVETDSDDPLDRLVAFTGRRRVGD